MHKEIAKLRKEFFLRGPSCLLRETSCNNSIVSFLLCSMCLCGEINWKSALYHNPIPKPILMIGLL